MSAPKYKSSSYDNAALQYQILLNKYTGENAYKNTDKASQQALTQAQGASEREGAAAQNLSRNAGYSRARAAQAGAGAKTNAFQNTYSSLYDKNLANINNANNALLSGYGQLVSGAQQKDANRYQSDSNRYGAAMGGIGGVFSGIGNMLMSDTNTKDIKAETDADRRRAELVARLRGC